MPLMSQNRIDAGLETLYSLVGEQEDSRSCRELDGEACRWVPRNFFVLLAARMMTNLGDVLSSPKTVLTWILGAVGAPTAIIALLVPVRESLSMLPQLALGLWIRHRPLRKPIWIAGSLLQALAVLGCAAAAAWLEGVTAGLVVLGCVVAFSLARSLNSIASKDILGKTIPKGRRGRLSGWATGLSGLFALGVGVWFAVGDREGENLIFYVALLIGAALLWLLAAGLFTALREFPGETAARTGGWRDLWLRLDLLRTDAGFRHFVITRSLLLCSALSGPFYVVLAREHGGGASALLGSFLVAGGLASSLSAPVWGTMADRSSRRVMIWAALLTSSLGFGAFSILAWAPDLAGRPWLFPAFFFGLGVAHAGVRAGRKTYLVDLAGGVKRTDYVSVSNTLIGVLLLMVGAATSALSFLAPEQIILGLSVMGLGGAGLATTLPEVQ